MSFPRQGSSIWEGLPGQRNKLSKERQPWFLPFAGPEEFQPALEMWRMAGEGAPSPPSRERIKGQHALQIASDGVGVPWETLLEATRIFFDSEADTLVSLNQEGEETEAFILYRGLFLDRYGPSPDRDRSRCFPFVVSHELNPRHKHQHAEEAETYRDRIGDRILNPQRVDPEMRHLIDDDLQRVDRVLSLPFGKKVLDVGCSDGTVTLMAMEKWGCEEAVGIDVAHSAVEEAQANARKRGLHPRAQFFASFIEELDHPGHTFDTICATETLEHVAPGHFNACLDNLVRMLKPTGNLIVTVPNRYPDSSYMEQKRDRWRWPAHHHFFSRFKLFYILGRRFSRIDFFPHDDLHSPEKGVYLICCCWEKK